MDFNNNITKYSDLKNEDSLSAFRGHAAQQFHGTYEVFYNFINEIKPKRILEIGTALGGFTTFLKITCNELNLDTNVRSYDIHKHSWYDQILEFGIDIRVENIFSENFIDVDDEVKKYIKQDGVTVILCDGGWKIGEFNVLSDYLKVGDFILAHDYSENKEIFEQEIKGKIWNWMEIQESDISESCKRNNLKDYNKQIFNSVAWVCKIKN